MFNNQELLSSILMTSMFVLGWILIDIMLKKRGPENVNVAASYNDLGLVHRQLGDLTQAKDFHEGAPPHSPGRVRNKRECSLF